MNAICRISICLLALLGLSSALFAQPVLEWKQTLSGVGLGNGITCDASGNVYISGDTTDPALGGPSFGGQDAFVAKYDSDGNQTWIRRLGTAGTEESREISADALGNLYITGSTGGALAGPSAGSLDAYIAKYNTAGSLQWVRQFGTSALDSSNSVSADGLGNAYVSGQTDGALGGPSSGIRNAFVGKYDASGNQLWLKQTGSTSFEVSLGVSAKEQSNIYATGFIQPNIVFADSQDYFLTKYDAAGNFAFYRQVGSALLDQATGVSADGLGSIYVSGVTNGMLGDQQFGSEDAFVSKFDASGNVLWTRQIGSNVRDRAFAVTTDQDGNIYFGGDVNSPASGTVTESDAFVIKLGASGNILWMYQMTGPLFDTISGISVDGTGNVYAVGSTHGPSQFAYSPFVLKISQIPEPTTLFQWNAATALILMNWRRRIRIRSA
jgi:hypothetical protein